MLDIKKIPHKDHYLLTSDDRFHIALSMTRSGKTLFQRAVGFAAIGNKTLLCGNTIKRFNLFSDSLNPSFIILRHPIYRAVSWWEWKFLEYNRYENLRETNYLGKIPNKCDAYDPINIPCFFEHIEQEIDLWFQEYDRSREIKWKVEIKYEHLIFQPIHTIINSMISNDIPIRPEVTLDYRDELRAVVTEQSHDPSTKYIPRNILQCPFYNRRDFAKYWNIVNIKLMERNLFIMSI